VSLCDDILDCTLHGHRIYPQPQGAEKIEIQTRYATKLYFWTSAKICII